MANEERRLLSDSHSYLRCLFFFHNLFYMCLLFSETSDSDSSMLHILVLVADYIAGTDVELM